MIIKTKLNVGDDFYVIGKRDVNTVIACTGCGGEGEIRLKDRSLFDCPKCEGHGVFSVPIPGDEWELKSPPWQSENPPNKYTHKVIFMQINSKHMGEDNDSKFWILYDNIRNGGTFREEVCFPTLTEAQDEIDRLNNKGENENS